MTALGSQGPVESNPLILCPCPLWPDTSKATDIELFKADPLLILAFLYALRPPSDYGTRRAYEVT